VGGKEHLIEGVESGGGGGGEKQGKLEVQEPLRGKVKS